ncbi:hypothetical protein Mgra_00001151, partial [Meloidogyne graminicola]
KKPILNCFKNQLIIVFAICLNNFEFIFGDFSGYLNLKIDAKGMTWTMTSVKNKTQTFI